MSTRYTLPITIPEEGDTTIYKNITVGQYVFYFKFQWAVASKEQLDIILNYINTRTRSDPLYVGDSYTRDYDYMEYYLKLVGYTDEQLEEWLANAEVLPSSIRQAPAASKLLILKENIEVCQTLKPVLDQYKETVRWQFRASCNGEIIAGFLELGGWYWNQDENVCFRFTSDLDTIDLNHLDQVTIEFEVNNA